MLHFVAILVIWLALLRWSVWIYRTPDPYAPKRRADDEKPPEQKEELQAEPFWKRFLSLRWGSRFFQMPDLPRVDGPQSRRNDLEDDKARREKWYDLHKMEYELAAARYENIYRAIWQNFSYMAVLAGGILTFGAWPLRGRRGPAGPTRLVACKGASPVPGWCFSWDFAWRTVWSFLWSIPWALTRVLPRILLRIPAVEKWRTSGAGALWHGGDSRGEPKAGLNASWNDATCGQSWVRAMRKRLRGGGRGGTGRGGKLFGLARHPSLRGKPCQ
jgi:hypothetical protein